MMNEFAPELTTTHWFNSDHPIRLEQLRGRVVMIEAFQMLCPGCVSLGLPQAQRVVETFSRNDLVVLGLHTVFEHHQAQGTKEALAAFLHEYRVSFPVGMDAPSQSTRLPKTMNAYGMQGTPTTLLIDRAGRLRKQHFGSITDLALGAALMALIGESTAHTLTDCESRTDQGHCSETACAASQ